MLSKKELEAQYVVITPFVVMSVKEPILYTNSLDACLCELKNGELICMKGSDYFKTLTDSDLEKVKNRLKNIY